jgi:hypothetical protein
MGRTVGNVLGGTLPSHQDTTAAKSRNTETKRPKPV